MSLVSDSVVVPDSLLASSAVAGAATVWPTGAPATGKKTPAHALQARLRAARSDRGAP